MFVLWRGKAKAARLLQSSTAGKDALCSLACIKLSSILFAGSLLFLIFPQFWWVDSAVGLILSYLIAKEGWETVESSRKENLDGGCGCH
jgi:divalent metal cation (Fe/Co/Zn/Cd) transporter